MSDDYALTETKFGFAWGPLVIERCISDPKGGVVITVRNHKRAVEIRSSPKGTVLNVAERAVYDFEKEADALVVKP